MNIDDVDIWNIVSPVDGQLMTAIFAKQQELIDRYDPIERSHGIAIPDPPYQLDDSVNQARIKDMAWRAVEEVGEAFEYEIDWDDWRQRWKLVPVTRHWFEEMADTLHFLTEMSIYSGHPIANVDEAWNLAGRSTAAVTNAPPTNIEMRARAGEFMLIMGLVGNCLKNKPWKQSQMPTDEARFRQCMDGAWLRFFELWRRVGAMQLDMYQLYMAKHQVNRFRQDTKY